MRTLIAGAHQRHFSLPAAIAAYKYPHPNSSACSWSKGGLRFRPEPCSMCSPGLSNISVPGGQGKQPLRAHPSIWHRARKRSRGGGGGGSRGGSSGGGGVCPWLRPHINLADERPAGASPLLLLLLLRLLASTCRLNFTLKRRSCF